MCKQGCGLWEGANLYSPLLAPEGAPTWASLSAPTGSPSPFWSCCCRSPRAASPLPSPPLPVPRGLVINSLIIHHYSNHYLPSPGPQRPHHRIQSGSRGALPPRELTHSRYTHPHGPSDTLHRPGTPTQCHRQVDSAPLSHLRTRTDTLHAHTLYSLIHTHSHSLSLGSWGGSAGRRPQNSACRSWRRKVLQL